MYSFSVIKSKGGGLSPSSKVKEALSVCENSCSFLRINKPFCKKWNTLCEGSVKDSTLSGPVSSDMTPTARPHLKTTPSLNHTHHTLTTPSLKPHPPYLPLICKRFSVSRHS